MQFYFDVGFFVCMRKGGVLYLFISFNFNLTIMIKLKLILIFLLSLHYFTSSTNFWQDGFYVLLFLVKDKKLSQLDIFELCNLWFWLITSFKSTPFFRSRFSSLSFVLDRHPVVIYRLGIQKLELQYLRVKEFWILSSNCLIWLKFLNIFLLWWQFFNFSKIIFNFILF
jgi:hypothetical protein